MRLPIALLAGRRTALGAVSLAGVATLAGLALADPAAATEGEWRFYQQLPGPSFAKVTYGVPSFPDALLTLGCASGGSGIGVSAPLFMEDSDRGQPVEMVFAVDGREVRVAATAAYSEFDDGVIPSGTIDVDHPLLDALARGGSATLTVAGRPKPRLDMTLRGSGRAIRSLVESCRTVLAGSGSDARPFAATGTVAEAPAGHSPGNREGGATAVPPTLPPEVAALVGEIEDGCRLTGQPLGAAEGFVQEGDVNADGRTDYLVDTSRLACRYHCGAARCLVVLFPSRAGGHGRSDFLGEHRTFSDFACSGDRCEMRR